MLDLEDITFCYPQQTEPAINGVSFKIKKNESVLITGASGSGKTTLARIISGFIPQLIHGEFHGNYLINNKPIDNLSTPEISSQIGLIQQNPENQFVSMFVVDEVAFGPENLCLSREEIQNRVNNSLRLTEIEHLGKRDLYHLSGGEQQKVAIASILTMNPQILILDEPSAQLDRRSFFRLIETLNTLKLKENKGLIIIDHQFKPFLPVADRLLILKDGCLVLDIPVNEINKYNQELNKLGVLSKKPQKRIHSKLPLKSRIPLLEIRDLDYWIDNHHILNEINFSCHSGEIIGITGPNGSGKTSLFLNILGLRRSLRGNVLINGKKAPSAISKRAEKIGLVFQNPDHQIFEKTVYDELLLAPRHFNLDLSTMDDYIGRLLTGTHLDQYRNRLPLSLSYGEKKRLTIISSEIYQPSILLLDEPFAGQDYQNIERILKLITLAAEKGRGIIIITHRPEILFNFCDRVINLDNGQITLNKPAFEAQKELNHNIPEYYENSSQRVEV